MPSKVFTAWTRLKIASPFETLTALGLMLCGILYAFQSKIPSVSQIQPFLLQNLWVAWLIVGGALVLVGIAGSWRGMRRAGLFLLSGGLLVYTVSIVAFQGGFPPLAALALSLAIAAVLKSVRKP